MADGEALSPWALQQTSAHLMGQEAQAQTGQVTCSKLLALVTRLPAPPWPPAPRAPHAQGKVASAPPALPGNAALGSECSSPAPKESQLKGARRAERLWGCTDGCGRHSPCYKAGTPAPQGQGPALRSSSFPLQRAEHKLWGSSAALGVPSTTAHQPPPHLHQGHSLDTGCFICSSWGRTRQHLVSQALPGLCMTVEREVTKEPSSSREHLGGRREARQPGITGCMRQTHAAWEEKAGQLIPG